MDMSVTQDSRDVVLFWTPAKTELMGGKNEEGKAILPANQGKSCVVSVHQVKYAACTRISRTSVLLTQGVFLKETIEDEPNGIYLVATKI